MADPQPYQISYSFAGFQANSPSTPLPATSLDNELSNIQTAISGLVSSVTDVRRSDGALKNGIVTLDAINESIRTAALSPVSNWEAETAFGAGQVVIHDGSLWSCVEAHTSGDDFDEDQSNGLWDELAELPVGPQGQAATIAVGAVSTGAPGSEVIVTNVGTSGAAVFDFTIPEGDQGDEGDPGPASWAPPVAWQTAQNYTATAPATVVTQAGETYVCLITHTSGTFSTDLAASRWIKVAAKGADGLGAGDVVGPASAAVGNIALFSNVSGKEIDDSGVAVSTDGTLASDSDAKVPTEKAVKSYANGLYNTILGGVSSAFDTLSEIATELGNKISTSAIGVTVQAYDVDTAKTDVTQTWTAKQTFGAQIAIQKPASELWETVADNPASGDNDIDLNTSLLWRFTTNTDTNFGLNFRGDGSTTLNASLVVGEAKTVVVQVKNGGTAYRGTSFKIDTSSVTPEWLGAPAPAAGTINKRDTYTFHIKKTADATFEVDATFAGGN